VKQLPKYVYLHTNIDTGEVIYVGVGTGERAWEWRSNKRSKEHNELLRSYLEQGYAPNDWATVVKSNLSSEEAVQMETEFIKQYLPIYNKSKNPDYVSDKWKFNEVHKFAKSLREMGYSYSNIAFLLGGAGTRTNTMSAWRMCNVY
jgi:hypothetical protein